MDQPSRKYEFGRFQLDPDERVLLRDGEPVPLGPKIIDTLIMLVENAGHIVDKDRLIGRVWPDSFVEDGSLTKNISVLRRILGEGESDGLIENVPRRGYRFNAAVTTNQYRDGDVIITRRARVRIIADTDDAQRIADEMGVGLSSRIRSLKTATRSLAVLPLRALGPEDPESFLGVGLADALITRLSNVRDVIVRPTSAVVNYSVPARDPVRVGRELRVESVLEGSFQQAGDTLRVTVQLISVEDEAPFWAEKFDAPFTDVFTVEDSISEQVVRALSLELTGQERARLTKPQTDSSEAYQAYVRGRYFWNARTAEWMEKALGHFHKAISIDPNYALAHAGLADCYNTLGFWSFVAPAKSFPLAKAAAARALELDEGLAEAHSALAWALFNYDWDFSGAEREFKRAIELNRGYSVAHFWYSMFLALSKRFDEALVEIVQAQEIDPLSLILNTDIGILLLLRRRYDEAIEQFQKTLELGPGYPLAVEFLGYTYGLKGMFEECIACYQKNVEVSGGSALTIANRGFAYAMAGRYSEALQSTEQGRMLHGDAYFSPHYYSQLYALMGDADKTFLWLERCFEERSHWMVWLGVNPSYDAFRSDPRFDDLLRRAGLALLISPSQG